jgi:hypothetical protein
VSGGVGPRDSHNLVASLGPDSTTHDWLPSAGRHPTRGGRPVLEFLKFSCGPLLLILHGFLCFLLPLFFLLLLSFFVSLTCSASMLAWTLSRWMLSELTAMTYFMWFGVVLSLSLSWELEQKVVA